MAGIVDGPYDSVSGWDFTTVEGSESFFDSAQLLMAASRLSPTGLTPVLLLRLSWFQRWATSSRVLPHQYAMARARAVRVAHGLAWSVGIDVLLMTRSPPQ